MQLLPIHNGWVWPRTALLTVLLLASPLLLAKRKDDVVIMKNGDRFTGEIKKLEQGELLFKSSYMIDSVHLDWREVDRIESKDSYIVTLKNGERVAGTIHQPSEDKAPDLLFQIRNQSAARDVQHLDVISIQQNEASFWNQLTGSVNYGFSYSSADSSVSSSLGADVSYTTSKNFLSLNISSQFSRQSGADNSNRFTFDSAYIRELAPGWGVAAVYSLLKSNEQNLDLRSTYGGGVSRRLYQSDRTALVTIAGTVYARERYSQLTGATPPQNNLEGLFLLRYMTFRFRTLDFTSYLGVFPGLTDAGRVRFSSQSKLQVELIRNFSWVFQLYENYDTKPPVNAPHNDLGVTTSLGWKF